MFNMENNITCSTNCKLQNSCNTVCPTNMVCFRYIIVNILHKDDDDDNNNNNNNNTWRHVLASCNILPNICMSLGFNVGICLAMCVGVVLFATVWVFLYKLLSCHQHFWWRLIMARCQIYFVVIRFSLLDVICDSEDISRDLNHLWTDKDRIFNRLVFFWNMNI